MCCHTDSRSRGIFPSQFAIESAVLRNAFQRSQDQSLKHLQLPSRMLWIPKLQYAYCKAHADTPVPTSLLSSSTSLKRSRLKRLPLKILGRHPTLNGKRSGLPLMIAQNQISRMVLIQTQCPVLHSLMGKQAQIQPTCKAHIRKITSSRYGLLSEYRSGKSLK